MFVWLYKGKIFCWISLILVYIQLNWVIDFILGIYDEVNFIIRKWNQVEYVNVNELISPRKKSYRHNSWRISYSIAVVEYQYSWGYVNKETSVRPKPFSEKTNPTQRLFCPFPNQFAYKNREVTIGYPWACFLFLSLENHYEK